MFREVSSSPNFSAMEHQTLTFWREHDTLKKLMAQNADGPVFSFIDGPITANNAMGVHHAWARTYKDLYQRYKAMRGYHQRYQNGFDCQGLWLEVEVEKALGFNSKREIEAYGLDRFAEQCRARVIKFAERITQQSIRLGQWMDWDNSYYTMSDTNIEYIWHFLKKVQGRGWLYQGSLSMPWCIRCGTSLAQHELADAYRDVTHRSIYLKLPLVDRPGEYMLVWTTTPWTLSSNTALAVHPELEYGRILQDGEVYYASTGSFKHLKGGYEVDGVVKGSELVGLAYHGPFDELEVQQGVEHKIIAWNDVSDEEGMGVVHIAPGCGAEDFGLSQQYGLSVIVPIDEAGNYYKGFGEYSGKNVREVTSEVFRDLTSKGYVYKIEDYTHRYPVCWRCGEDLVFRVVNEWFISADGGSQPEDGGIRPLMKAAADKVRWIPEASGKRMQGWLDNMRDWCISRKRYWGLPLPFYKCEAGHFTYVGSRAELRERATDPTKVDTLKELHRPWIDEITIHCAECGNEASRVPEVGDCWLDAGIVPFSTLKYLEDKSYWQSWFPAEFITEMREQVRLWFYSMLFMSVTLEGVPPYQNVLTFEEVRDEKGERLSKSKGNGVPYDEAVEKMSADVMRWMYAANNINSNINFGYGVAKDVTAKLLTLWHTYSFFVTYANLDNVDVAKLNVPPAERSELDRWVLARLHLLVKQVRAELDDYDSASVTWKIQEFVEDLSNWYVRRSRRRFWKSESDSDKLAAYATLYECLTSLCKVMAPIMPFLSEEMYQNLVAVQDADAPQSVHLCKYPEADETLIDEQLLADTGLVIKVVGLGRAARYKSGLKVRQPLAGITVRVRNPQERAALEQHQQQVIEELNVKAVNITADASELVSYIIKPNLRLLGKKYGKQLPAITTALTAADAGAIERNISAGQPVNLSVEGQSIELLPDEVLVETKQKEGFAVMEDEGLVVALDTNLTPELKLEGTARDLVRYVQDMRKAAKFNIADRIRLYVSGNGPTEQLLGSDLATYIANETLARDVQRVADRAALPAGAYTQEVELDGTPVLLGIEQTGEQAGEVRVGVDEE